MREGGGGWKNGCQAFATKGPLGRVLGVRIYASKNKLDRKDKQQIGRDPFYRNGRERSPSPITASGLRPGFFAEAVAICFERRFLLALSGSASIGTPILGPASR